MVRYGSKGLPYFLVKYEGHIQLEKAATPEDALKQAFREIKPGMQFKPLNVTTFKAIKKDYESLKNSPEGWEEFK